MPSSSEVPITRPDATSDTFPYTTELTPNAKERADCLGRENRNISINCDSRAD